MRDVEMRATKNFYTRGQERSVDGCEGAGAGAVLVPLRPRGCGSGVNTTQAAMWWWWVFETDLD
jgi:hypothetical protein